MIVDQLTDRELSVEDCVRLSEDNGANMGLGTDMRVLGPILADKFNLVYNATNDIKKAITHLRKGGKVAVLVGGDREGYVGLFTKRTHFILLIDFDEKEFSILDPSLTDDKFLCEGRIGRVRVDKPFVYSSKEEIELATEGIKDKPKYYLFSRKRGK